jgi:hypothetical protein
MYYYYITGFKQCLARILLDFAPVLLHAYIDKILEELDASLFDEIDDEFNTSRFSFLISTNNLLSEDSLFILRIILTIVQAKHLTLG